MNNTQNAHLKSNIYIGTSGYSYPDWRDVFYPPKLPEKKFLQHYQRYFDAIELNYTYYKMPESKQIGKMVESTGGRLIFTVKAHQSFTHEEDSSNASRFVDQLTPMLDASVLGCVLLQFPYSFRNTDSSWHHLTDVVRHFRKVPLVVEFRNIDWMTDLTFHRLTDLNIGLCSVDEPDLQGLPQRELYAVSNRVYLRFHGRNKAKWWDHENAFERYDYLYSFPELSEWVTKLNLIDTKIDVAYAFFNNHYRGQAVQNAQLLMAFLTT